MVQVLKKIDISQVRVREVYDLAEIKEALESKLYVPDYNIRNKIISELITYLKSKFKDPRYKIKPLIAYNNTKIVGFVIGQIDPFFTSYSRKCGTFGWLFADSFKVCHTLIKECEIFLKENKVRKVRGNINFPKNLGGFGIQFMGFKQQMLYGVAYTNPQSKLLDYLSELGYRKESEYSCVYVAQKSWDKGKKIDRNIEFRYGSMKELYGYVDDIRNLAIDSFHEILPDASGSNRILEFFKAFESIPKSFYRIKAFNPKIYSDVPHFVETWETQNLEKIEPLAPMAFDKNKNELIGILLGLPDLFQTWRGDAITRCNVDTAMVKKGYFGKGIFSALNNLGQLTANLFGVNYFEGTGIWSNNSRAISTIFPHCEQIRKHYVVHKRL